ncbi:MAG: hypothetical protein A3F91_10740 [Flavobacteria bacterium RIFCSPLOWO2_12_FULL_35_11]|nr:MAG: hypothetical protein A3F91_10740 [Flavobacteria bacterium RIFCSPLOWO2_12_FULL_35_11]
MNKKVLLSIGLTAIVVISLVFEIRSIVKNNKKEKSTDWTDETKLSVKHTCLKEAQYMFKDTLIADRYCQCYTDRLTDSISYAKYAEVRKKTTIEERLKDLGVFQQSCLTDEFKSNMISQKVINCMLSGVKQHKMQPKEAREYCECIIGYIENKHGSMDSINDEEMLSIMKNDAEKLQQKYKDCYEEAISK